MSPIPSLPARTTRIALAIAALSLGAFLYPMPVASQADGDEDLSPQLELLRQFLGAWVGRFEGTEGADARLEIRSTWTPILKGRAVREVRTVATAEDFEKESIYYFDREAGVVSYLTVTNNGYVSRGQITFDGEVFVETGTQIAPDSSVRATRGTYHFRDDGTLVNEGGHVIVFRRASAQHHTVPANPVSLQRGFPVLTGPYLGQKPPGRIPEVFALGVISRDADAEHSAAVSSPSASRRPLPGCQRRRKHRRLTARLTAPSSDAMQHRDTTTDYMSQPRPGASPVLFAPGFVSTTDGMYGTVVFSPEQDQAFWAKDKRPGLFFSRLVAGRWTAPSEFPFKEGYRLSSPFFSADGERLYFLAAHHGESGLDENDEIWVVDRTRDGWGVTRELDSLVNSVRGIHWQFSVDEAGDVYFGGEGADLYVAEFQNGKYRMPVRLPPSINTDAPETGPEISRDGSMLLFDRWFDSSPYIRIMVSFRNRTGAWSEPIELSSQTGAEQNDMAARLSPDEKYLFFQSQRAGSDPNRSLYWMEAGFLSGLRQQAQ